MKYLLKLSFFSYVFAFITAANADARVRPVYTVDLIIDTGGAAVEALIKTISLHPFIFAIIAVSLVFLFKVHDLYEESLADKSDETVNLFIEDDSRKRKPMSLAVSRFLYIGTLVLLIGCSVFFFRVYGKNISPELEKKKIERDKIDYNAKTAAEAYKNTH